MIIQSILIPLLHQINMGTIDYQVGKKTQCGIIT